MPRKKRAYRAVCVKDVKIVEFKTRLADGQIWAGLDVGKEEVFVVVRDSTGSFERPWKVRLPQEGRLLVEKLVELADGCEMIVSMESTGTYGDALRQVMLDSNLDVHLVSGKASSDYSEIFDGVPSSHDGKDAAIIAELSSIGKSRPWPIEDQPDWEGEMACQVSWMTTQDDIRRIWLGKLEALVARHWPEASRIMNLTSITLLRILAEYGGPSEVSVVIEDAKQKMRKWGGSFLKEEKIDRLVESAQTTIGMRMNKPAIEMVKRFAKEVIQANGEINKAKKILGELTKSDKNLRELSDIFGAATACVLYSSVGDPRKYHCAEAYRKALGLNLKERSSGKYQGKLKITKRGPSIARKWLYFAAMRFCQKSELKGWYEKKKEKNKGNGKIVLVALMRKLPLAIYATAHGKKFDCARLVQMRKEA